MAVPDTRPAARNTILSIVVGGAATLAISQATQAQGRLGALPDYDDLSFFGEVLARDVGGATLRLNSLIDLKAHVGSPPEPASRWNATLQLSVSLETGLPNGWNTGIAYTGVFETGEGDDDHHHAVYVDAPWGTLRLGRVTGLLASTVARRNRVGNAMLVAGSGLAGLDETGLHYVHAINACQIHLALDRDGDAQAALLFEGPVGPSAHAFGIRGGAGNVQERAPTLGAGDFEEVAAFYGHTLGSLSVGFEFGMQDISIDGMAGSDKQRYASAGWDYKVGRTSLSAEVGRSGFRDNVHGSVGLGLRHDIARGLSGNIGVNYDDDGASDAWRIPVSIRYEF